MDTVRSTTDGTLARVKQASQELHGETTDALLRIQDDLGRRVELTHRIFEDDLAPQQWQFKEALGRLLERTINRTGEIDTRYVGRGSKLQATLRKTLTRDPRESV
jgi:hypothetical protein